MAPHPMTSPQTDSVQFEAAAPRITLRNHFAHPYDSAIAAARTCYAPRIIGPEEITDKQRLQIGAATFFGGHHRSEEHTSELQSHSDLHSFPTRRSSDLCRGAHLLRAADHRS